jgi:hypothetical protein
MAAPRAAGRLGTVALVYAAHAALALAFAWPVARLLGDPTLAHPRGDRVLFEPGAAYLIEVLRIYQAPLTSVVEGMSFAVLGALYLGLFPLSALLHALAEPSAKALPVLVVAVRRFGPMSLLLGASLVATFAAWSFALVTAGLLETKVKSLFGVLGSDIADAGFKLAALGVTFVIAVIHDLARAAIASRETSAVTGIALGVQAFRAYPARAIGAFALRGLVGVTAIFLAGWAAAHIGIETEARFAAVTLLHQTVAFGLVFLRADWLASAIQLVRQLPAE